MENTATKELVLSIDEFEKIIQMLNSKDDHDNAMGLEIVKNANLGELSIKMIAKFCEYNSKKELLKSIGITTYNFVDLTLPELYEQCNEGNKNNRMIYEYIVNKMLFTILEDYEFIIPKSEVVWKRTL